MFQESIEEIKMKETNIKRRFNHIKLQAACHRGIEFYGFCVDRKDKDYMEWESYNKKNRIWKYKNKSHKFLLNKYIYVSIDKQPC